jgi:uncharacterized membrane protein YedE/YeeE
MKLAIIYLIGVLFGLGISLGGMADPAKVVNFFDVAGSWDPSLAFVMAGALGTTAVGYRVVLARSAPLMERQFVLPTSRSIDLRLLGGATVFGIGWGLTGFCPGGALPALGTAEPAVVIFAGAMIAGILIAKAIIAATDHRSNRETVRI